jgi:hypothetical protein
VLVDAGAIFRLYIIITMPFFFFFLSILLQSRSLFVKNLNFKTADESLKKHFSDHMKEGRILSVRVIILVLRTFNVIYI